MMEEPAHDSTLTSRHTSLSTLKPLAADASRPESKSGVNIDEAKREFSQLERQLSRSSLTSHSKPGKDVEKAEQADPFDLREYLSTTNDANSRAGVKHKHVGVTWQDLEVKVIGGVDFKVCINHKITPDCD